MVTTDIFVSLTITLPLVLWIIILFLCCFALSEIGLFLYYHTSLYQKLVELQAKQQKANYKEKKN